MHREGIAKSNAKVHTFFATYRYAFILTEHSKKHELQAFSIAHKINLKKTKSNLATPHWQFLCRAERHFRFAFVISKKKCRVTIRVLKKRPFPFFLFSNF